MSYRRERFSRFGSGRSKQDEIGRTICERVKEMFESRWKYLCPFDIATPETFLRYALRPEEWKAIELLMKNPCFPRAMNYADYVAIYNAGAGYSIRLMSEAPLFKFLVPFENLPSDLAEKVHLWQIRSRAYRDEVKTISGLAEELAKMCTTAGQIKRVWPELMGFMPDMTKEQQMEARAKSPYPDGVYKLNKETGERDKTVMHEHWKPENLAYYNDAITEALILPPYECDHYPEILDIAR